MKGKIKKVLLVVCSALAVCTLASCEALGQISGIVEEGKGFIEGLLGNSSETPEESSSPEETSSPTESEKPECTHVYADEYTCHDRECTVEGCDYVAEVTTDHAYGDWIALRDAECESEGLEKRTCGCGESEERSTPATGHTYEDKITCHDRTCTVEDCGHVEAASTAHNYGDWTTVKKATCQEKGQESRTCEDCGATESKDVVVDHDFGEDGECSMCQTNVKELFITVADDESVEVDVAAGTYKITSAEDANSYAVIPGSVLSALKEMGYTTLTFKVTNPAPGLADMANKCKAFMIAADSQSNLWAADTAICYGDWLSFWNGGKVLDFTVDLAKYAGHDLHIYTTHTDAYPTIIQISEFIDYENPLTFMEAGDNGTVEYVDGKGWHIAATDNTQGGYYAKLSEKVVQYYIQNGYNCMKLSFVNSFGLEVDYEGAPVNTTVAILPEKAAGGNDWYYFNGFISQKAVLDEATGVYYTYVDLTDTTYDFTKAIEFYFVMKDVNSKTVGHAYISGIEFIKHTEHEYTWEVTTETNCKEHGVETGTCSVCKATTTRTLEDELKEHSYAWEVTTPGDCENQGVETGTCSVCGDTQTRPTENELKEHYYEWVVTTPATCTSLGVETGICTGCGDTKTRDVAMKDHTYAWEVTTEGDCKTPAVETGTCSCGATTTRDGAYGEHSGEGWTVTSEATCVKKAVETGACSVCGEEMTREVGEYGDHSYGANAKCTACGDSLAKDLIVEGDTSATDTIKFTAAQGAWEITSTDSNSYAMMDGTILQSLYDAGYTKLTVTVTNPAPGLADANNKCKSCYVAADSTSNLWSADTAIAFYDWQTIWNAGKKVTIEIDLAKYAGHNIYIFTNNCDAYATEIVINELIDYEHPEARLVGASNGKVEYIEGKGWHVSSVDGATGYYANIPATVLQYYIANGYKTLTVSYVNTFNLEGVTTAGTPVNINSSILLEKAAGGNDWGFSNSYISQKLLNKATGEYYAVIDLTSTAYDYTKDIEIYFAANDVAGNAVGHTYISGLEFSKEYPAVAHVVASTNGSVEYIEGKGWHVWATDGANAYNATISASVLQYYIANGYTTLKISFVNTFDLGVTTAGTPVNITCAFIPKDAAGSDDWAYNTGFISARTYDETTNSYYTVLDLTDTNYDFTKDLRIYFTYTDAFGGAVGHTYISGVEFGKPVATENAAE